MNIKYFVEFQTNTHVIRRLFSTKTWWSTECRKINGKFHVIHHSYEFTLKNVIFAKMLYNIPVGWIKGTKNSYIMEYIKK